MQTTYPFKAFITMKNGKLNAHAMSQKVLKPVRLIYTSRTHE